MKLLIKKGLSPAFVVRADKAEEFINHKNPEALKRINEVANKFKKEMNIER